MFLVLRWFNRGLVDCRTSTHSFRRGFYLPCTVILISKSLVTVQEVLAFVFSSSDPSHGNDVLTRRDVLCKLVCSQHTEVFVLVLWVRCDPVDACQAIAQVRYQ